MKTINVDLAIEYYLNADRLGSQEIMNLYDCGHSTAAKLKKMAKNQESEDRIITPSRTTVGILSAYKAWGIDAEELIRRQQIKQNLLKGVQI